MKKNQVYWRGFFLGYLLIVLVGARLVELHQLEHFAKYPFTWALQYPRRQISISAGYCTNELFFFQPSRDYLLFSTTGCTWSSCGHIKVIKRVRIFNNHHQRHGRLSIWLPMGGYRNKMFAALPVQLRCTKSYQHTNELGEFQGNLPHNSVAYSRVYSFKPFQNVAPCFSA